MRNAVQTIQRRMPCGIRCQMPTSKTLSSVMGSMNFQARPMSWSMRRRGKVPRTQMKAAMKASSLPKNQMYDGIQVRNENGEDQPPRNSVIARPEVANMQRYSPRKNSANLKPEYSM